MALISIVILTKNEAANISTCLNALKGLSADVLVIDSGSTDGTVEMATQLGARVISVEWQGYSATKNIGNQLANHDWILSLDADEEINDELRNAIRSVMNNPIQPNVAFSIQRKMVFCGKVLHHGAVSNEFRTRLFNRQVAHWNNNDVHEELEFSSNITIKKLPGFAWHHSYQTSEEHIARLAKYAQLSARQLFKKGKQVSWIKLYLSPLFGFIKNYVFKAGFLDGRAGFRYALNEMHYVKQKYLLLNYYTHQH